MSFFSTTVSASSFLLSSDGYVQGTLVGKFPDRFQIEAGVVAPTQTTPLYGGQPLSLAVKAPTTTQGSSGLGELASLSTAATNIDGWCIFDQASAGVITPYSNVPLYYANNSVNFVRVGSAAWVALPVNPAAVNSIAGAASNLPLFWNFAAGYVDIAGTGALGVQIISLSITSKTVTYSAGPPITANWAASGSVIVVRV